MSKKAKKEIKEFGTLDSVDIWASIFQFLGINELMEIRRTCSIFNNAFEHPVSVKTLDTKRNPSSFAFLYAHFLFFKTNNLENLGLEYQNLLWATKISKSTFRNLKKLTVYQSNHSTLKRDVLEAKDLDLGSYFPKLEALIIKRKPIRRFSTEGFLFFHPKSYGNLKSYDGEINKFVLSQLTNKLEKLNIQHLLKFQYNGSVNEGNRYQLDDDLGVIEETISEDFFFQRIKELDLSDFSFNSNISVEIQQRFPNFNSKIIKYINPKKIKHLKVLSIKKPNISEILPTFEELQSLELYLVDEEKKKDFKSGKDLRELSVEFNQNLTLSINHSLEILNVIRANRYSHKKSFDWNLKFPKAVRTINFSRTAIDYSIKHKFAEYENLETLKVFFNVTKEIKDYSITHPSISTLNIKLLMDGPISIKDTFKIDCKNLKFLSANFAQTQNGSFANTNFRVGDDITVVLDLPKLENLEFGASIKLSYALKKADMVVKLSSPNLKVLKIRERRIKLIFEKNADLIEALLPVSVYDNMEYLNEKKNIGIKKLRLLEVPKIGGWYNRAPEISLKLEDFFKKLTNLENVESILINKAMLTNKRIKKNIISSFYSPEMKSFAVNFKGTKPVMCYNSLTSAFPNLQTLKLNQLPSLNKSDLKIIQKKTSLKFLTTFNLKVTDDNIRRLPIGAISGIIRKFTKICVNFSLIYDSSHVESMVIDINLDQCPQLLSLRIDNNINLTGNASNLKYLSLRCSNFVPEKTLECIKELKVLEIRECKGFVVMDENYVKRILDKIKVYVLSFRNSSKPQNFLRFKDFKSGAAYYQNRKENFKNEHYKFSEFKSIQEKFEKTCLLFSK